VSSQVLHFIQLYLTGRCQLFDYGSEAANVAAYHQRTPPVVSDAYHTLRYTFVSRLVVQQTYSHMCAVAMPCHAMP